ncbi:thermonuclease family protein [Agrobacterium tumefaciens]|uniref:thermonuclease family protein n=1 Tax=Agrobacterium tumefaciens TaxID=358 RepID=UPI0015716A1B|nr:thermonuclease family protein [Agrobacterium tumefaciens]NTD10979.1 thermonuclease family protein [Agrobacterium tumefaciens]
MSKVVRFRPRQRTQPASSGSFLKLVALGMLGSFIVGASASYFIDSGSAGLAQATSPKGNGVVKVYQADQQKAGQASLSRSSARVAYRQCVGSVRVNCIVDGDTLWSDRVKIRVADIDAPEVGRPRCAAEKARGDRATIRLMELVNAGPFEMQSWPGRDEDKYGRKLRVLVRDGRSLGDILVSEGLARTWTGKRQPWC